MEIRVYISQLKDDRFDYDVENPNGDSEYAPAPISGWYYINGLYWDVVGKVLDHDENTKQTDWGTFAIRLTNTELIRFLLQYVSRYDKYKDYDWRATNSLLNVARSLPDGEYLLVGQELS